MSDKSNKSDNVDYLKDVCKDVIDLSKEALKKFSSVGESPYATKNTKQEVANFHVVVTGFLNDATKLLKECDGLAVTPANNMALLNCYTEMSNHISNIKYYFECAVKMNDKDRKNAKVK